MGEVTNECGAVFETVVFLKHFRELRGLRFAPALEFVGADNRNLAGPHKQLGPESDLNSTQAGLVRGQRRSLGRDSRLAARSVPIAGHRP